MSRTLAGAQLTFPSVGWQHQVTLMTLVPEVQVQVTICPMFVLWPELSLSVTILMREWAAWWCNSASSWTMTSAPPAFLRRDVVSTPTDQSVSTSMCQSQIRHSPWERTPVWAVLTLPGPDQLAVSLAGSRSTQSQLSLTAAMCTGVRTMWPVTWGQVSVADWSRVTSNPDIYQPKSNWNKLLIISVQCWWFNLSLFEHDNSLTSYMIQLTLGLFR